LDVRFLKKKSTAEPYISDPALRTGFSSKINIIRRKKDFQLIENRGIAENKFLDAKIEWASPCPYCGKYHVFHVNELTCPFS